MGLDYTKASLSEYLEARVAYDSQVSGAAAKPEVSPEQHKKLAAFMKAHTH